MLAEFKRKADKVAAALDSAALPNETSLGKEEEDERRERYRDEYGQMRTERTQGRQAKVDASIRNLRLAQQESERELRNE